jgi:tRNA(fMet)-specific endonuclease VapC
MALHMLDTDTASFLIRRKDPALDARVSQVPLGDLCISAVTRGELLYGLRLLEGAHRLESLLDLFLRRLQSFAWDSGAADHFAKIAASLHKAGTKIGTIDAMIAGHARSIGAILITNNVRHFVRVEGLDVENWTARDHS